MFRIAVDVMGGDRGPATILDGALDAARESGVPLALVGPQADLRRWLAERPGASSLDVAVVHAGDAIGMGEPATAVRRRPGASIRVAAAEVAAGRSAALFSAGHTGATVLAAHGAFGRMSGVERPALAATVPTRDAAAVLLDVGANARCRPGHLVQFAAMGAAYARMALGIERPRVGLLSIGEEESKGNELTREVHRLLKATGLNFTGNIEARDVYAGLADVIVCDGFTGNIAIKVSEGLVEMIARPAARSRGAVGRRPGAASVRRAVRPVRAAGGRCGIRGGAAARRRRAGDGRPRAVVVEGGAPGNPGGPPVRVLGVHPAVPAGDRGFWRIDTVIAFIFPGQGSQAVGMGKALAEAFDVCRQTFAEADEALGEPLSRLIFEGPEDQLRLTQNTQPAILTVSVAAWRLLASRGFQPAFVAGHSLGEYSAHVCAGTIEFADAVRIVRRRGRYMQEAVPVGQGAMAAVMGLDAAAVAQACAEAAEGEVVSPANMNMPGQVVIAGATAAVARAGERAKAMGAKRVVPLPVSAPFHCALMKPAEDRLAPGTARAGGARPARAGGGERGRGAEARRGVGDRGAGAPGVVAGPLGGRRAAACIRGRPQVC